MGHVGRWPTRGLIGRPILKLFQIIWPALGINRMIPTQGSVTLLAARLACSGLFDEILGRPYCVIAQSSWRLASGHLQRTMQHRRLPSPHRRSSLQFEAPSTAFSARCSLHNTGLQHTAATLPCRTRLWPPSRHRGHSRSIALAEKLVSITTQSCPLAVLVPGLAATVTTIAASLACLALCL